MRRELGQCAEGDALCQQFGLALGHGHKVILCDGVACDHGFPKKLLRLADEIQRHEKSEFDMGPHVYSL